MSEVNFFKVFKANTTDNGINSNSDSCSVSNSELTSSHQLLTKKSSGIHSTETIETNINYYYNTNHKNAGKAIIFNHIDFKNVTEQRRNGTEKDADDISKSLKNYGFEVRLYTNETVIGITNILNKVSQENHRENDCLIVVVMSHGENGKVSAFDDYYSVETLWKPFLGENCESLINKPKLFFIQACRGNVLENPVQYLDNLEHGQDIREIGETEYTIPNSADLLIMYACFEGKSACRSPTDGSWFIQSLCSQLNKNENNSLGIDLFHLLTAVNQQVACEYQSYSRKMHLHQKKQMPNFVSTLTKLFMVKAKPIDEPSISVTLVLFTILIPCLFSIKAGFN